MKKDHSEMRNECHDFLDKLRKKGYRGNVFVLDPSTDYSLNVFDHIKGRPSANSFNEHIVTMFDYINDYCNHYKKTKNFVREMTLELIERVR